MHALLIDFQSVLVAPLLSFLPDALVHDDHAVVAEAADDGFRDACSRAYLREAGQVADGIDEVRAHGSMELFGRDYHEGRGRVLEPLHAGNALHGHFAQDGILHRVDTVLQTVAVLVDLGCYGLGDGQEARSYIYNNVSHVSCVMRVKGVKEVKGVKDNREPGYLRVRIFPIHGKEVSHT